MRFDSLTDLRELAMRRLTDRGFVMGVGGKDGRLREMT